MVRKGWAMATIILLALQRALTILVSLVFLLALIVLLARKVQVPSGESGPSEAAMAGGNGDPGEGTESPGPYMVFDLFWELPAQGPNASEASPAEPEPGDKDGPQEGHEAVPVPGENSEAHQAAGVEKRFSSAEDTETDPNTVEGMANRGLMDAKVARCMLRKLFLLSAVFILTGLLILILMVAPAWAKDIKERFMALRANSELPDSETLVKV